MVDQIRLLIASKTTNFSFFTLPIPVIKIVIVLSPYKNLTLKIGGHPVLVNGNLSPKYSEAKGKKEFRKKTINIEINLGKSKQSALVMTSDLSPEYISINSDYRS